MRGEAKTPGAAVTAFVENVCGFKLNEWQRNMIRGVYDSAPSSPYTIASAPFRPANKSAGLANKWLTRTNVQVGRGMRQDGIHRCSSEAVPQGTPWGGTPTSVDGSPKGP